jgi:hypothetical protein
VFFFVILFIAVSTVTCTAADSIFSDGFESGDTTNWNATVPRLGVNYIMAAATALSVTAGAALDGAYGLELTPGTGTLSNGYVTDQTPASETGYRARFLIDVNTILYTSGESLTVLQGVDSGGLVVFALRLVGSGTAGQVELQGRTYDDSSATHESQPFALPAGSIPLGIEWYAASSSTSSDGQFLIFINDAVVETIPNLDNDSRSVSEVRLGLIPVTVSSATGSYYVDLFESWRVTAATSTTTTAGSTTTAPPSTFTIAGTITGEVSDNVSVELAGAASQMGNTNGNGYYEFTNLIAGVQYIIIPQFEGYVFDPPEHVIDSLNGDELDRNFMSSVAPLCPTEVIYGEDSEEVELLRALRDEVLSKTPEGREIIKQYYNFSPLLVEAMKADEGFENEVENVIDEVLMIIR